MVSAIPKPRPSRRPLRGRLEDGTANPIDTHVGNRIRERRMLCGLTQNELGDQVGIAFQQVQKYERGANRISAGRLYSLACVLGCSPSHFFEGMDAGVAASSPASLAAGATAQQPVESLAQRGESLKFIRSLNAISNDVVRKAYTNLLCQLALTATIGDAPNQSHLAAE